MRMIKYCLLSMFGVLLVCCCTNKYTNKKNEYQHYLVLSSIKSSDLGMQEIFGETKVEFFTKHNILVLKRKTLVINDGLLTKDSNFEYFIVDRFKANKKIVHLFNKYQNNSSTSKEYKIIQDKSIDSLFFNAELLSKLKKSDYENSKEYKIGESNFVSYYNLKNKIENKFMIDSVVFSFLKDDKDSIIPYWKIDGFCPVISLELYSKMPDSSLNSLSDKIIKQPNLKNKFLDSIILKYEPLL